MVSQAEAAMPQVNGSPSISAFTSFNMGGLGMLHTLVLPLVIIFTIANSLAPTVVDGGSWYKIFFNLAILAGVSGICMIFIPQLAAALFKTVQL
jgi:archaellum biogenesis protein FlaJ (TadC family)